MPGRGTHRVTRSKTLADPDGAGQALDLLVNNAGIVRDAMVFNYTAAKAGIVGLTLTCSLDLARIGVTVTNITPGVDGARER